MNGWVIESGSLVKYVWKIWSGVKPLSLLQDLSEHLVCSCNPATLTSQWHWAQGTACVCVFTDTFPGRWKMQSWKRLCQHYFHFLKKFAINCLWVGFLSRASSPGTIKCQMFPRKHPSQTSELIARGPSEAHDIRRSWGRLLAFGSHVFLSFYWALFWVFVMFWKAPLSLTPRDFRTSLDSKGERPLTENFKTSSYPGQREEWPLSGAFPSEYVSPWK